MGMVTHSAGGMQITGDKLADGGAERLRVSSPMERNDWVAGYHLSSHLLAESHQLIRLTGLDLVSLHILAEVAIGSAQRTVRHLQAGHDPVPLVPMSSRKVALMTGFPRETVRRRIGRLVETGYLRKERNGLLPTAQLNVQLLHTALREAVARHARLTNQLIESGMLVLSES